MAYPRHGDHALILLLTLIIGCASTGGGPARSGSERPGWVDDPGNEYPEEFYIAAVASGDTEEIARKNAAARIALVFEADIESGETLLEDYFESESADGGEFSKSSSLIKTVRISTTQTLKALVIPKTWQDPVSRRHYALAYLDRDEARLIYADELGRLDRDIGVYLDYFNSETEKLVRLAYLDKALTLAAQRDMLGGQISIISHGAHTYKPTHPRAELVRARSELRRRLGIRAVFSDPQRREFNNAVRAIIEEFGFRIVDSGGDYQLSGGLSMQTLEREGHYVSWQSELHLGAREGQAEIITLEDNGREGHLSYPEAERRAEREATKRIRKRLYEALSGYLDSLLVRR